MNRILSILTLVVLSAVSFTLSAVEISGIEYELNVDNQTAKVAPKTEGKYQGDIIIPEEVNVSGTRYRVVGISGSAFKDCEGVTSVEIPYSVAQIGDYAFLGCTSLKSIVLPNSVVELGWAAFYDCSGLISIKLSDSLQKINSSTFAGCSGLESIIIPSSVMTIEDGAFDYCSNLKNMSIEDGEEPLIVIKGALRESGIENFYMGRNINYQPFEDYWGIHSMIASLTQLTVGDKVTVLGKYMFYDNVNLKTVILGKSLKDIGERVFHWCEALTSIELPSSLVSIGEAAFYGCSGLLSIEVPNSVTKIGKIAFEYCTSLKSAIIGDSVTEIGEYAFSGCTKLETLKVLACLKEVGTGVFSYNPSLKNIYYSVSDPQKYKNLGFSSDNYFHATLWVPEEAVEKCKVIEPWGLFRDIRAFDFSGIDEISHGRTPNEDNGKRIYTVFGVRVCQSVDDLAPGIYVIDGKKRVIH